MIIAEMYRYPLKGGQGQALRRAPIFSTGFADDRRWVLVDAQGRFMSQREYAAVALIRVDSGEKLKFDWQEQKIVLERGNNACETRSITVWKDQVEAWDLGDRAADFFSSIMGQPVRLCEAKPSSERIVDPLYTESRSVHHLFADAFPYLIISQESLDLLNDKLQARGQPRIGMDRFRPNLVIQGWHAHAEDMVQTLRIGRKVRLRLVKPCSRCNVPTIDQTTAIAGSEPLPTLALYRKLGTSKIYFGMNAWVLEGMGSEIQIGDSVEVET